MPGNDCLAAVDQIAYRARHGLEPLVSAAPETRKAGDGQHERMVRCASCSGSGRRVFKTWMGDVMDRTCERCDGSGAGWPNESRRIGEGSASNVAMTCERSDLP